MLEEKGLPGEQEIDQTSTQQVRNVGREQSLGFGLWAAANRIGDLRNGG